MLKRETLLNLALVATSLTLTALVLEVGARLVYTQSTDGSCIQDHPTAIYQYAPNCSYTQKLMENREPIVYSFNACGYRSPHECPEKPDGAARIVTIGDSFMMGAMSPIEDHFVMKMLETLRLDTTIDWQNLGTSAYDPLQYYSRFDEALALDPNLIIVGLTPNDLFSDLSLTRLAERKNLVANVGGESALVEDRKTDFMSWMKSLISKSRALSVTSMYMLSNDGVYRRAYLSRGSNSDFLSVPLNAMWEEKITQLTVLLDEMQSQAQGIPLIVVHIPQRIQNVLVRADTNPDGVDPYLLSTRLHSALNEIGVPFIDGLVAFEAATTTEALYFPVDGHLTSEGNRVLGEYLADQLRQSGHLAPD